MRVLRVRYNDRVFYASLVGEELMCLNRELGLNEPIPLAQATVLPPVLPTKIVCVGLNYRQHAAEMDKVLPEEPLLFLKPSTAVIGTGQPVFLPPQSRRVDYEGELALVMGKACRNVDADDMAEFVFGYSCANDVTARDLQEKDGLYARAKGFDTFAPIGPWIETEVEDPSQLTLTTTVNGETRQQTSTSDMIFSPYEVAAFISQVMTLLPGDVILTGTPSGVGPLKAGDEVRVDISDVGVLINPVIDDPTRTEPEAPPVQ